ncbi:MAG: alpha/beta hydrolase [Cyclobacteriaceae bacterium]|nr:alpha/beta hydrolase [Cyclobacteriaceae bacterium]
MKSIIWIVLAAFVIISCSRDDGKPVPVVLDTYTNTLGRSAGELKTYLGASGLNLDLSSLKYDVEIYSITYKTTYKSSTVIASGLVMLPKTTAAVPMVSFHHGTIAAHDEAPSALPLNSTELLLYTALASPGFIAVVPDFLGFGSSSSMLHPYYVREVSTTTIIDMLKAARELAIQKDVNFSGNLMLAGYSQGGYMTMATHRAIEKDGLPGFSLVASFPAAGGYDVKGMQEYFFAQTTYDQPFYLAFVASAYKSYYGWAQPLSDMFQQPYADRMSTIFDGNHSGSEINAQLTNVVADLVTPDLLANIDNDPKYQYVVTAFESNSLVDWKPSKPVFMYHGDADVTVPYQNSVDSYNKLIANGASPSTVTLTTFPGKTHSTGVLPYIEALIPQLTSRK